MVSLRSKKRPLWRTGEKEGKGETFEGGLFRSES
ncbi:unnamed protein product [Amoebophrya sp. A25]|nr:unnamed protein product [Amoebophrya sp. A25]|eukprot:GSA25T00012299001.1